MFHLRDSHERESEIYRETSVTTIAGGQVYVPFDDLSSPVAIQAVMIAICTCLGNLIDTTKVLHVLPATHMLDGRTRLLEPCVGVVPPNPVNDMCFD
jgi:F0F1-type ATP synthase beta subunit